MDSPQPKTATCYRVHTCKRKAIKCAVFTRTARPPSVKQYEEVVDGTKLRNFPLTIPWTLVEWCDSDLLGLRYLESLLPT